MTNNEIWEKFELALKNFAPNDLNHFSAPASEKRIQAAENTLGLRIPEELRIAFLRHDGLTPTVYNNNHSLFVGHGLWCPLELTISLWQTMNKYAKAYDEDDLEYLSQIPEEINKKQHIKLQTFNRNWIPVGIEGWTSGSRSVLYCDLDPAAAGKSGQIIRKDLDQFEPFLIAPSFNDHLRFITTQLETGGFKVDRATGKWHDERGVRLQGPPSFSCYQTPIY